MHLFLDYTYFNGRAPYFARTAEDCRDKPFTVKLSIEQRHAGCIKRQFIEELKQSTEKSNINLQN